MLHVRRSLAGLLLLDILPVPCQSRLGTLTLSRCHIVVSFSRRCRAHANTSHTKTFHSPQLTPLVFAIAAALKLDQISRDEISALLVASCHQHCRSQNWHNTSISVRVSASVCCYASTNSSDTHLFVASQSFQLEPIQTHRSQTMLGALEHKPFEYPRFAAINVAIYDCVA